MTVGASVANTRHRWGNDYHRATLAMRCAGLTDEELRQRSMPPSTLSLLGLVRHMAEMERPWCRRAFEDNDAHLVWSDKIDFQAAYDASASTRPRHSRPGRLNPLTWPGASRDGARTYRCAW